MLKYTHQIAEIERRKREGQNAILLPLHSSPVCNRNFKFAPFEAINLSRFYGFKFACHNVVDGEIECRRNDKAQNWHFSWCNKISFLISSHWHCSSSLSFMIHESTTSESDYLRLFNKNSFTIFHHCFLLFLTFRKIVMEMDGRMIL